MSEQVTGAGVVTPRQEDPTLVWRRGLRVQRLVGRSHALARVLADIDLVRGNRVPVLLLGEHGTGKGLVARAIHDSGPTPEAPFVHLNSATIPEPLLESELFGALPGSHSTARRRQVGRVEAARGGTLFLDEVAELSPGCQARLLQLLQEGIFYPLGATTPVVADVRVLSATNAELDRRVAERTFRADLYYRLRGVEIRLPPLRERREDIEGLARSICARVAEELRVPPLQPSPEALAELSLGRWPGNIRELENALREGLLRAHRGAAREIAPVHLGGARGTERPDETTWQAAMRQFQRGYLQRVLEEVGWSVVEAARRLDLSRAHVYNLVRELGLSRPAVTPGGSPTRRRRASTRSAPPLRLRLPDAGAQCGK